MKEVGVMLFFRRCMRRRFFVKRILKREDWMKKKMTVHTCVDNMWIYHLCLPVLLRWRQKKNESSKRISEDLKRKFRVVAHHSFQKDDVKGPPCFFNFWDPYHESFFNCAVVRNACSLVSSLLLNVLLSDHV